MVRLRAIVMALSAAFIPFAFAVCSGRAAPVIPQCAPGTLTQYEDLGDNGCRLDDKIFGGFSFSSFFNGPSPDGNDILVTPIATPFNPGFMLVANLPFEATQISGRELWFLNYFARVQPGGNPIGDLSLKIGGITVTADATVNVGETASLGALFQPFAGCPTKTADLTTKVTPMQNVRMADASFDPTALVDVSMGIDLSPETRGSATLTMITVQFSEMPEPPPLVVLAGSLVSWAFCRSVKRKRET